MADENNSSSDRINSIDLMLKELEAIDLSRRKQKASSAPPASEEAGFFDPAVRGIAEFNQALILDYLPAPVRNKLNDLGLGVSQPAPGAGYGAVRMIGKSAPFAIAPYAAALREAQMLGVQAAEPQEAQFSSKWEKLTRLLRAGLLQPKWQELEVLVRQRKLQEGLE